MILKVLLLTTTALLSSSLFFGSAMAIPTGGFIGLNLGYSQIAKNLSTTTGITSTVDRNKKVTGGISLGSQSDSDFGIYFSADYLGQQNTNLVYTTKSGNFRATYYDLSAMADLSYTLGNKLSVFFAGGAAYVASRTSGTANALSVKKNATWWRPKATVGADFSLTDQFAIGASYSYIFGYGKINNLLTSENGKDYLPNISVASVNFIYTLA